MKIVVGTCLSNFRYLTYREMMMIAFHMKNYQRRYLTRNRIARTDIKHEQVTFFIKTP